MKQRSVVVKAAFGRVPFSEIRHEFTSHQELHFSSPLCFQLLCGMKRVFRFAIGDWNGFEGLNVHIQRLLSLRFNRKVYNLFIHSSELVRFLCS